VAAALLLLSAPGSLPAADPAPAAPVRPADPAYAPIEDAPGLPRVLLIGDSVSVGYTLAVRKELAGKANVHRPPQNCGSSAVGLAHVERWLGGGHWDVIHFNHGLHDLSYEFSPGRNQNEAGDYARPDNGGHHRVAPEDYRQNLTKIVELLRAKAPGAKLVFATTTPVSADLHHYVKGSEQEYNRIAVEVMTQRGIQVNDLWAFATPQIEKIQEPGNPHFTAKGSAVLAREIARVISAALADSGKPATQSPATSTSAAPGGDASPVLSTPGLVCFWDFQEGPARLTSKGPSAYTLEERNGKIASANEGVFGASALKIERGQWLRIKRADCPALLFRGRDEVTVIAWVKRGCDAPWQYIAGVWNERDSLRQYALFTCGHRQTHGKTMERTPAEHQVHGYVSDVGGATPGKPFCYSYATGKQKLEQGTWTMIAFTYDQKEIRVYFNGELDANEGCNPFPWDKPLLDPGEKGADFTVAQRALPAWPGYPDVEAPTHKEGFGGLLGGLAVFHRALAADELRAIHGKTSKGPR
jgi:hypothetical protein